MRNTSPPLKADPGPIQGGQRLRALVTGATGFIGSHLVDRLSARGWKVTCLVRPASRTAFLRKLPLSILRGDMSQPSVLENSVRNQDFVFHLAARIRSTSREAYARANHLLTRDLALACLRVNPSIRRFIYVSSISAAGPSQPGLFADESRPPAPTSEYGRTKLKGEEELARIGSRLPWTIIRPPNVYGPRQQETELLVKLIRTGIVPLLKESGPNMSLIYIRDLIDGMIEAALSSQTISRTYYLTDGCAYSWRQVILSLKRRLRGQALFLPFPEDIVLVLAALADILKRSGLVRLPFGRRTWEAMVRTPWLFSAERAAADFGFRPAYSLEQGLTETIGLDRPRGGDGN